MSKKNILIISYYWPPSGGSGVQRWLNFANKLCDNYNITVITTKTPNYQLNDITLNKLIDSRIKVVKISSFEPAKFFQSKNSSSDNFSSSGVFNKIKLYVRANFFFPDSRMFWINKVSKFTSSYILKNNIDCFITTSPPFSLNVIGYNIKIQTNCKWISDYRDPWSDFFQFKKMPMSKSTKNKHKTWEYKSLKTADSVIVTSPSLRDEYLKINSNTFLINNGFKKYNKTKKSEYFNLVYSGVMKSSQNPKNLWKVLYEISSINQSFSKDLRIKLIGNFDNEIITNTYVELLKKNIKFFDYVKQENLNDLISDTTCFIACDINDQKGGNLIPGKIYYYLSFKKYIIAFTSNNSDTAKIIKETNSGEVFNFSNENELKNHILELYKNFKKNKKLNINKNFDKYLISNLTTDLENIIINTLT
ncbi:MAG: hypothetical protein ISP56_05825 [Flavobacteriaceae bacterium]|nr:hypothetical protein [Flavobacteriaceae bacterium]